MSTTRDHPFDDADPDGPDDVAPDRPAAAGPEHGPEDPAELLRALRRVIAEVDPVPPDVLATARAAFGTRDLDRQLAELVADSAGTEVPDSFETVRAGVPPLRRLLSFATARLQIDLEVSEDPDGGAPALTITGQVEGAEVRDGRLDDATGGRELGVDSLGRFLAAGVRRGPLRLRFTLPDGAVIATAWVAV